MKEVAHEEWIKNPTPRMMWVWNDDFEEREKQKVVYFIENKDVLYPVIVLSSNAASYKHCAEIEEPKTRRMTKQELTWWLQDGIKEGKHREWKFIDLDASAIHNIMFYIEEESNDIVGTDILIRENGGEWRAPLVEVIE